MYHKIGSLKSWILEIENKSLGILGSLGFKPPQSLEFWKYSSPSLVKLSSKQCSKIEKQNLKRNIRDCF